MNNYSFLRSVAAVVVLLGFSLGAHAQTAPEKRRPPAAKHQKPVAKTRKVWTEDNISSVRTPADMLIEAQDMQEADAPSKPAQATAVKPVQPSSANAPLATAKSADDADAKIAWEERDIQGQRETIERLQQQLSTASPDEREHLQKLIEQHTQYLADTQKEMQGLLAQKKALQAKGNASNNQ